MGETHVCSDDTDAALVGEATARDKDGEGEWLDWSVYEPLKSQYSLSKGLL